MVWQQLSQIIFAFIAVIGLMLALSYAVRKLGLQQKWQIKQSTSGAIKVVDSLFIDHKRRIMILQFENVKYMLLLDTDKAQILDKIGANNVEN